MQKRTAQLLLVLVGFGSFVWFGRNWFGTSNTSDPAPPAQGKGVLSTQQKVAEPQDLAEERWKVALFSRQQQTIEALKQLEQRRMKLIKRIERSDGSVLVYGLIAAPARAEKVEFARAIFRILRGGSSREKEAKAAEAKLEDRLMHEAVDFDCRYKIIVLGAYADGTKGCTELSFDDYAKVSIDEEGAVDLGQPAPLPAASGEIFSGVDRYDYLFGMPETPQASGVGKSVK